MDDRRCCCDEMAGQFERVCPQHGEGCGDQVVRRSSDGRFFLQAPNASYTMAFCPWCGARLQELYEAGSDSTSERTS